jgi:hypothetical protein
VIRSQLLRELAEALPVGAAVSVPREWLLELLEGAAPSPVPTNVQAADMTIADLALRFRRHASTIRGWLDKGAFAGAYKLRGREWRIPAESLAAFEEAARREAGIRVAAPKGSRHSTPNLADWRKKVSA